MGPRTSPDILEKRKFSCPCRGSNPGSSSQYNIKRTMKEKVSVLKVVSPFIYFNISAVHSLFMKHFIVIMLMVATLYN
jgi:hypothetical protein